MVICDGGWTAAWWGERAWSLIAAGDERPLLWRLDPERRGQIAMALVGLVILGMGLVLAVYLGGRMARRIARQIPPPRKRDESDWDRKSPAEEGEADSPGANGPDRGGPPR